MRIERRRSLSRMLGALGATAIAPPLRAQRTAGTDWNRLVEAARKEGKVTVYTAAVGQPSHRKVAEAFEKKYGIGVTYLEARASELRERIRTEQAAGRFIGDVSHNGATTSTLQAAEGVFQPHGGLPGIARLRAPFAATDLRVPIYASCYAILVNQRLVKPEDMPRSWADLTDPKWKGKILADDMRALGGGAVIFSVLTDKLGRGFHDKLALNGLEFSRDLRASERRVARGDFAVWIPMSTSNYGDLKGLPVTMVTPAEGYPYITFEVALLKNAPNPNAARLFMDFYLSDEAQLIHDRIGITMVTQVSAPPENEEANQRRTAKLLGTTDAARQDEMLALAKTIYK